MTKLDGLLEQIDPKVYEKYFNSVELVKSNFRRNKNRLEQNENYMDVLVEFMREVWKAFFGEHYQYLRTPDAILLNTALTHLEKVYPENTDNVVANIMETGVDGGIYRIYQNLADKALAQVIETATKSAISEFLESMTNSERMQAAEEYSKKFYKVLPMEFKNDVTTIFIKFENVLLNHTQLIWGLRNLR